MFVAFCENPTCGAIFPVPNLIGGTGNVTVQMSNTRVGPCPRCGAFGRIPDGVYTYANQVVDFVRGPRESVAKLKQIEALLNGFRGAAVTREEVVKKVREVSPSVADTIEKAPKTAIVQHWVLIAIAFVTLAILVHTTYFKKSDKELETMFIEHLLKENTELKSKQSAAQASGKSVSRNSLCPCGSAKKYKKCCGDPARFNPH